MERRESQNETGERIRELRKRDIQEWGNEKEAKRKYKKEI